MEVRKNKKKGWDNINKIAQRLLDLIYPQVCGICGKIETKSLCKKCEILLNSQAKFIIESTNNKENFDEHIYIFQYEGIIRNIILQYKFKDKVYIYKTFTNFILKNEKIFKILKSYDTIIPVPISSKRKKERGYNQSGLLAKEIGKNLDIVCIENCLFKTKNIIEQSKLNRQERIKNIQGAYELRNKELLQNKKILLIDDIYTTGSTANECSKMLKQAQVNKIGVFTLAKD